LAAVFWIVLSGTVFGRHVRAIGDNEFAGHYTSAQMYQQFTVSAQQ